MKFISKLIAIVLIFACQKNDVHINLEGVSFDNCVKKMSLYKLKTNSEDKFPVFWEITNKAELLFKQENTCTTDINFYKESSSYHWVDDDGDIISLCPIKLRKGVWFKMNWFNESQEFSTTFYWKENKLLLKTSLVEPSPI